MTGEYRGHTCITPMHPALDLAVHTPWLSTCSTASIICFGIRNDNAISHVMFTLLADVPPHTVPASELLLGHECVALAADNEVLLARLTWVVLIAPEASHG